MLVETLLGRFVVIRNHTQDSVHIVVIAGLEFVDNSLGVISSATDNDGNLPLDFLNHELFDVHFLFGCKCRSFSGCDKDSQEVGSAVYLITYKMTQGFVIDREVAFERRYEGYAHALNFSRHIIILNDYLL